MPNPNSPFGFRPIARAGGSPFSITEYGKPATDTHPIFSYDLVGKITGAGGPLPEAPQAYTLPRIQSGSQLVPGTSLWLGGSIGYGPASTASIHHVHDEVDTIYNAQASGAVAITNALHAGMNALVLNTGGPTGKNMSGFQVDSANIAVTAAFDLKILRVSMVSPNQEGPNAIVEVVINKHALGQGSLAA